MSMERLNNKQAEKRERPEAANENIPQGNGVDAIHEERVYWKTQLDAGAISREMFDEKMDTLNTQVQEQILQNLDRAA